MCKPRGWFVALLALSLMALTPAVGASPPEYEMTELGMLSSSENAFSVAYEINNRGEVVGDSMGESGLPHGFLWKFGEMTDLGTPPGAIQMHMRSINGAGDIVGSFIQRDFPQRGFIYRDGVWTVIENDEGDRLTLSDINARGQVLGWAEGTQGPRTFIWEDGRFEYLNVAGGIGMAINNRGQVVGYFFDFSHPSSVVHSFLWDAGEITAIDSPSGVNFQAFDINDHGEVVGGYFPKDGRPPTSFVWSRGDISDLPGLDDGWSRAVAINNRGQVVGISGISMPHAVLWELGNIIDLGTAGQGCFPSDINARGQVVGNCIIEFSSVAYIWKR